MSGLYERMSELNPDTIYRIEITSWVTMWLMLLIGIIIAFTRYWPLSLGAAGIVIVSGTTYFYVLYVRKLIKQSE